MQRRTVHRSFVVLAVAAAFTVAGARPAAAQELGLFERGLLWLESLWTAPAEPQGGLLSSAQTATARDYSDKGLGVDPNGGSTTITPPFQPPANP